MKCSKNFFLKYSRFSDGFAANSTCILYTYTATKNKSVFDLLFKLYWSKTDKNDFTYQPKSTVNFINNSGTCYAPGWQPVNFFFMVWTDYDNISLYRACIEGIEYMWVDTREQYPSKKVVKKV